MTTTRWLIAILLPAVLLRVGVTLYLGDTTPPGKDETSDATLATRLATGYGYSFPTAWYPFAQANTPTAHWSFLYTALLSAIYAYFILYDAMVQTEAFFICAVLWSLERALALAEHFQPSHNSPFPWIAALTLGLSLGIATLLRQSILPWVAVLFLWLLFIGWRAGRSRLALLAVAVAGVTLALCVAPFTLRNYRVYGEFLLVNPNAGYAMYSAQHPLHGITFQEYAAAPLPGDLQGQGLNEAQWDRASMARGTGFALAEPGRYLLF